MVGDSGEEREMVHSCERRTFWARKGDVVVEEEILAEVEAQERMRLREAPDRSIVDAIACREVVDKQLAGRRVFERIEWRFVHAMADEVSLLEPGFDLKL